MEKFTEKDVLDKVENALEYVKREYGKELTKKEIMDLYYVWSQNYKDALEGYHFKKQPDGSYKKVQGAKKIAEFNVGAMECLYHCDAIETLFLLCHYFAADSTAELKEDIAKNNGKRIAEDFTDFLNDNLFEKEDDIESLME